MARGRRPRAQAGGGAHDVVHTYSIAQQKIDKEKIMRGRKQDGLGPSDRLVMRSEASARKSRPRDARIRVKQINRNIWLFLFVARWFVFVVLSARRSIVPVSVPQPLVAATARNSPATRTSSNTAIHMYVNAGMYPISLF